MQTKERRGEGVAFSDSALKRIDELKLKRDALQSIADAAQRQSSVAQYPAKLSTYVRSIRRQYAGADVRVREGYVFVFDGAAVWQFYIVPDNLLPKREIKKHNKGYPLRPIVAEKETRVQQVKQVRKR